MAANVADYIAGLTKELNDVNQKTERAREILKTLPPEQVAEVEPILSALEQQRHQLEEALANLRAHTS